jgi:hypothetical protein
MNCASVTSTNLHERTMGAKLRDGQIFIRRHRCFGRSLTASAASAGKAKRPQRNTTSRNVAQFC